jgi:hypothetical protein
MKRSEDQWPQADYSDVPEGFGTLTPETMDEIEASRRPKMMPLSDNGQDIENSKRSRGERL